MRQIISCKVVVAYKFARSLGKSRATPRHVKLRVNKPIYGFGTFSDAVKRSFMSTIEFSVHLKHAKQRCLSQRSIWL